MCHQSVHDYVQKMITPEMVTGRRVLECGSYNVNGSVREYVEALGPQSYLGIDLRPGPGVDLVMTADKIIHDDSFHEEFDLVISTEMLEHVEDWRTAILGMLYALKPGGHLVLTTRSPGFPLHDYPGDHWRYPWADMKRIIEGAGLTGWAIMNDPLPGHPGVFVHAIRPGDWQWTGEKAAAWSDIELPKP